MKINVKNIVFFLIIALVIVFSTMALKDMGNQEEELVYSDILELFEEKRVVSLEITNDAELTLVYKVWNENGSPVYENDKIKTAAALCLNCCPHIPFNYLRTVFQPVDPKVMFCRCCGLWDEFESGHSNPALPPEEEQHQCPGCTAQVSSFLFCPDLRKVSQEY